MMAKTKEIAASDLKGPEWESSDEELEVHEGEQEEEASSTRKNKAKTSHSKEKPETSNVVYIGHLPKDCQENELIGFLKQFGKLVQLRVCRSHRTGGVKGYAFAKFQDPEVAAIVADTMNGHLLFQKRLICHVVPPDRVHNKLFSSENKTTFQRPRQTREIKSLKKMKEATGKLLNNEKKKKNALKAMGIDYDFPGYRASLTSGTPSPMEEDTLEKQDTKKAKQLSAKKSKKSSEATTAPVEEMEDRARPQSEKKRKKEKKKRRKTN